ncbi:hypothetical protein REPUB_Repub02eG0243400 [Reevesia pubescens]
MGVVINAGMIEYYDISGCYILRPRAILIWENMQVQKDGFPFATTKNLEVAI